VGPIPYTAAEIRELLRLCPVDRSNPAVLAAQPRHSVAELAHRESMLSGPVFRLSLALDIRAHWGEARPGLNARGVVPVPTMARLAADLDLPARTLRHHLAQLEAAGFVRWIRRPSRSRRGALLLLRYPEHGKRIKPAAATVSREAGKPLPGSTVAHIGNAGASESQNINADKNHGASRPERSRRDRKPAAARVLVGIEARELGNPAAWQRWQRELIDAGRASPGPHDLLEIGAAAIHAARVGKNPPALFADNIRHGRNHAADIDEDRAREILNESRGPRRPPAWAETLAMLRERERVSAPPPPVCPTVPAREPRRTAEPPIQPPPDLAAMHSRLASIQRLAAQYPSHALRYQRAAAELAAEIERREEIDHADR